MAAGNLCNEIGGVNIYNCHIGLVEAIAPLKINSVVVGYVMFGQIIDKDNETESKTQILKNASKYCEFNIEHLLKLICIKLNHKSMQQQNLWKYAFHIY